MAKILLFRRPALCLALLLPMPFDTEAANSLQCYESPGTLNYTCIDPAAARANGELRSSPLYSGGPRGVTQTPYTLVTNCTRGVSTLQDRTGANFGGGTNNQSPAIQSLSEWLCSAPKPIVDKSVRQF